MEENVKKFLDFLGVAEGADYDVIVGGSKFTDFSKHPGVVGLRTKEGPSTAAGKYQITQTTYNDFAPKLGITDFSPESQDKIALALIEQEGALDDVRKGDWNSAINKLGGRWASLPSSKYSQPKRDWGFVQKHLGISGASPMPDPQFRLSDPDAIAPSSGPDPAALVAAEAQRDTQYGGLANQLLNVPKALQLGFENENSVYNFLQEQGMSQVDPDWTLDEAQAKKVLEGIPRDNWDYILQAKSAEELSFRRGRVLEALERQKELSQMGFVGTLGTLTGALVDLPTLVGFVPLIGGTALVSRTSRIANALASGIASGASNVAVDAAMLKYRPLGSTDELYFSAVAGLGFGALGGAMVNPARVGLVAARRAAERELADAIEQGAEDFSARGLLDPEMESLRLWGLREANTIQRQEIQEAGLDLTQNGRIILEDPSGTLERLGIVGAVRKEKASIPVFDRTIPAGQSPTLRAGEEVPTFPNGRPRPALSTKAILNDISRSTQDPMLGPLAARLLDQIVDDVDVYVVPRKDLYSDRNGSGRAYYDTTRHAVFIRSDSSDRTKLHEIAHAVTVQKLNYGMLNRETVHGQLTKELQDALFEAQQAAQGRALGDEAKYYLQNIYEFTAGLYSGKTEFIDFLASIKTTDGNLLSKLVDVVRKLLGMDDKETNLLLKSMDLTDRLIGTRLDVNIRRPGVDPNAPPAVSVHMAPMEGVMVDEATVRAVNNAELGDIFGWSFGLEHRLRRVKDLPAAKRLADRLIGTTVGYRDHAVVQRNAYDQAIQLSDGWVTQVKKVADVQLRDYMRRTGRKWWQRSEVSREWNTELGNYIRGFPGDYDKSIVTTGNEIRKVLADVVDNINNPARATGGTKRGLTQDTYLDEDGNELLTDPLPKNPNYLPRANDVHKWDQMVQQFGREFVERWWAGAFKSANPDVDDAVAARFGKWYVKRVEEGKKSGDQDFLSEQLRGYDKEALKASMVRSGMGEAEAQEVLDNMFPVDHKGRGAVVSNTKQRSAIDETFSMDAFVGGERVSVTMNNFVNTDTMGVLEGYFRRMGGAVSLANHADVYKQSDIAKSIQEATSVELGSAVPPATVNKLREEFQFTFDRLLHRPVEEFSVLNKSMEMWRNFNVIRLMGAAVYNQIQELSQIIGTMGWKLTLQAIPELRRLTRDLRTGKVANPLLDDLENMIGGAGSDLIMRADFNPSDDWVRERGNTAFNRWLDGFDNGLRKMSSGVLKYTGMTGMMVQQKRIHAIAFINHFFNTATTGGKLRLSKERLAWMGLGETDVSRIMDNMRKYAKSKTGETGKKVGTVDFDAWTRDDPESLSKFVTAFQRESRRVVQENDLTSATTFMSKSWGKTMFQFLNFVMQAWNKSLMFGLNHRDLQTLSTVLHGAMFAGLVYVARTSAQMVGMSDEEAREFSERRLSPEQVARNAVGRIAQASLLPNIIDQVSPVPLFSGMRTTSDTTDFLTSNPTLSSINTLFSAWRKGVRNSLSDEYQFTEQDVRSYLRLAPLNNVIGISGFLNSLAADLPRNEEVNPERQ